MQDRLGQLVLGPAMVERKTQMQLQLRGATGGGVGNHTNEGSRLQVEARSIPQRAEYRLLRDLGILLHDWIGVDRLVQLSGISLPHQLPTDLASLRAQWTIGHRLRSRICSFRRATFARLGSNRKRDAGTDVPAR